MVVMSENDKIYVYIKNLFSKEKYTEVLKYADKFIQSEHIKSDKIKKVKFMKAKSLRYLHRYDESIEILKTEVSNKDSYYTLELFFLYYYLNRYEDAKKLLNDIYNDDTKTISNYAVSIMDLVIEKELTNKKRNFNPKTDYLKYQIANYDEKLALEHILLHTKEQLYTDKQYSCFNENIDIKYLFNCIKNNIKNSKKTNTNDVLDIYYFTVPNIGYYNDCLCNLIKVIVAPGTNNIINLYPAIDPNIKEISILECDYNKLFPKKEEKVKTLSRIDKFNAKYKRV